MIVAKKKYALYSIFVRGDGRLFFAIGILETSYRGESKIQIVNIIVK